MGGEDGEREERTEVILEEGKAERRGGDRRGRG